MCKISCLESYIHPFSTGFQIDSKYSLDQGLDANWFLTLMSSICSHMRSRPRVFKGFSSWHQPFFGSKSKPQSIIRACCSHKRAEFNCLVCAPDLFIGFSSCWHQAMIGQKSEPHITFITSNMTIISIH